MMVKTRLDTSRLRAYGIQTEETTHRIHVDTKNRWVFVYRTADGVGALPDPIEVVSDDQWDASGYYLINPRWLKNGDENLATARGIRISPKAVDECRGVRIPEDFMFDPAKSTTAKGKLAVKIVTDMFKVGRIPLHMTITEVHARYDQIIGKDIDIGDAVIQVKFDSGCAERGLFMQTHECNPYGMH